MTLILRGWVEWVVGLVWRCLLVFVLFVVCLFVFGSWGRGWVWVCGLGWWLSCYIFVAVITGLFVGLVVVLVSFCEFVC